MFWAWSSSRDQNAGKVGNEGGVHVRQSLDSGHILRNFRRRSDQALLSGGNSALLAKKYMSETFQRIYFRFLSLFESLVRTLLGLERC